MMALDSYAGLGACAHQTVAHSFVVVVGRVVGRLGFDRYHHDHRAFAFDQQ